MGCRGRGNFPFSCPPRRNLSLWSAAYPPFVAVEPRNRKRGKVNGIEPIIDRQQADSTPRSASRSETHADASRKNRLVPAPAAPASRCRIPVPAHAPDTRAPTRVHRTGSFQSQRFVRTLFVILSPKTIKGPLLRAPVGRRRRSRLLLQRAMHALVPSVLFRMSGRNALRHDPQLHPPHRQARQPRHRSRRKRRPVVGANRARHSALAKRRFENRPHPRVVHLLHRLATQQIAAAGIGDRQRIDPLAICGSETSL